MPGAAPSAAEPAPWASSLYPLPCTPTSAAGVLPGAAAVTAGLPLTPSIAPDPPPRLQVSFQEQRLSLLAFLTSVCAIIGGVFTVSGIIDATIYAGQKVLKHKMELGKLS